MGSQNKKNAYTLISGEIELINKLLEKISIIIKYLNGEQIDLKYEDIKYMIHNNIIR